MEYNDLLNESSFTTTTGNFDFATVNEDLTVHGDATVAGALSLSSYQPHALLYVGSTGSVADLALSNLQTLMGITGADPEAVTLSGMPDGITLTKIGSTCFFELPQPLHTAATPTFDDIKISNLIGTNQIIMSTTTGQLTATANPTCYQLTATGSIYLPGIAPAIYFHEDGLTMIPKKWTAISYTPPFSNRTYILPDAGADCSFMMTAGDQTIAGTKTFESIAGSSFTRGVVMSDAKGVLSSRTYINISENDPTAVDSLRCDGTIYTDGVIGAGMQVNTPLVIFQGTTNQLQFTHGDIGAATYFNVLGPPIGEMRQYTIPDAGADCSFMMTAGDQTISGTKTFSDARLAGASHGVVCSDAKGILSCKTTINLTDEPDTSDSLRCYNTIYTDAAVGAGVEMNAPRYNIQGLSNQLQFTFGGAQLLSINAATPSASRVYTLPDAGADCQFLMTAGTQTITGTKSFASLRATNTTNQLLLGTGNTVTISVSAPTAPRTYTFPDAGGDAQVVMTGSNQSISGTKIFAALTTSTAISTRLCYFNTSANVAPLAIANSNGCNFSILTSTNQLNCTLVQDLSTTASPQFASIKFGTNNLTLTAGTFASPTTIGIPNTASGSMMFTGGAQSISGVKTFQIAANPIFQALTAGALVLVHTDQTLRSGAIVNGNGCNVSFNSSTGEFNCTMSQNLSSTGSPTFATLTSQGSSPEIIIDNNATNTNRATLTLKGRSATVSAFKIQQNEGGLAILENFASSANMFINTPGSVIFGAHVVPNIGNVRNLGSTTERWNNGYINYLTGSTITLDTSLTLPAVSGTGGGSTALDGFYEASVTVVLGGAIPTTNLVCVFIRIGRQVTFHWGDLGFGGITATSTNPITSTGGVPAWARPSSTTIHPIMVASTGSTYNVGTLIVTSAGDITITASPTRTNFASGSKPSLYRGSATWHMVP